MNQPMNMMLSKEQEVARPALPMGHSNASQMPGSLTIVGKGFAPVTSWIRFPSGLIMDLANPGPGQWLDSDLAHRLAGTYRWQGESRNGNRPLSVAQHSLMVLALRRQFATAPLNPLQELAELLHDGEEGILGWDAPSKVKSLLGPAFKAFCDRLLGAVWEHYGLPAWTEESHAAHKYCDNVAAATEAVRCIGWSHDELRNLLGIVHPVLEEDPLAVMYDCEPWRPWEPEVAAERFLNELTRLQRLAKSSQDHA